MPSLLRNRILWLSFIMGAFIFSVNAAEVSKKEETIKAEAIRQGATVVIGSLGKPLGTAVEIEAVVVEEKSSFPQASISKYLLEVKSVDGVPLLAPVKMQFKVEGVTAIKLGSSEAELDNVLRELQAPKTKLRFDPKSSELKEAEPISASDAVEIRKNYVGSRHRLVVFETAQFVGLPSNLPLDGAYLHSQRAFGFQAYLSVLIEREMK